MTEFPVLETKRLRLRQITRADAHSILKYLSDQEVMKYYGLEPFKSVDDALNEITWYQSIYEKKTGIRWGITLKGQEKIIGSCGFLNIDNEDFGIELCIYLNKL